MSKNVSDLLELISAYYPKLRKVFRNLMSIKNIPISMTQLTCLNIIDRQEQLTMSALAEELSMSNQQLTKVVDALVGFEMVERVYDANNRRKIYAKITPKGKQLLTDLNAELDKKMAYLMRKFSDDEMDKLYECVAHIASYFGYKE
ncbi:MAG: MarR family winged helix-turn-helix transcriptional regulator [Candidatus Fimimonas sp.]